MTDQKRPRQDSNLQPPDYKAAGSDVVHVDFAARAVIAEVAG
ncbi:hypothetical protein [Microbacterium luteum]|nr:hypothetical protein [Microbacterium luteum]